MPHRVILGISTLSRRETIAFPEFLAGGLVDRGHDAKLLLTGIDRGNGSSSAPSLLKSPSLICERLPVGSDDTWGQRWEALERYLEERAPCFYLMPDDWRYNVVVPRLSRNVKAIGFVGCGSEAEIRQFARLGRYLDAVIAGSGPLEQQLARRFPFLKTRLVCIPVAGEEGRLSEDTVAKYVSLLDRIEERSSRGGFVRRRGLLVPPPRKTSGAEKITRCHGHRDVKYANKLVPWPDAPLVDASARPPAPSWSGSLAECKVIVATSSSTITGVDTFAGLLVRGLCERGIDARLYGPSPNTATSPLTPPTDLPFEARDPGSVGDFLPWPDRWRLAIEHIERLAPCIYVPDYNTGDACICPQLFGRVRVVGIGHSDDPWHYENLCRIGHACDAIVGVSSAITGHLRAIAPGFSGKMHTVPYGIALPPDPIEDLCAARSHRLPGDPLRIIYTGRLVQCQKRALDLISIARALDGRGVPFELAIVGDGELRRAMEEAAADLIDVGKIVFKGTLSNSDVLRLLPACDAYLLPSAFEGLSLGMLEAMSRGVVPVVSDIRSGVPDAIVAGENGLIAPVGDTEAFADRLEWLWRNPADRRQMSVAAARTIAEKFSLGRMIDDYVEIFSGIVGEPSRRATGPIVPPPEIARWMTWPKWFFGIVRDPIASLRRVSRRISYSIRPRR
ncbi:MAG: glycosyltransferase family 4 protein [Chthoniobacterales bacterium]|nr:glycosyltransferase family 4 protein [Chthoniobacterales bacterium]